MRDKWESLNDHIKLGMKAIVANLNNDEFDKAEKIQKTLTVDWPSQCGSWMVGIRHLIQESKKAYLLKNPKGGAEISAGQAECDQKGYLIPVAQK